MIEISATLMDFFAISGIIACLAWIIAWIIYTFILKPLTWLIYLPFVIGAIIAIGIGILLNVAIWPIVFVIVVLAGGLPAFFDFVRLVIEYLKELIEGKKR